MLHDILSETPPRAWGRLNFIPYSVNYRRNTPTGVGKTLISRRVLVKKQKHPHGRGEDQEVENDADTIKETPPRAWGRLGGGASVLMQKGNTPTGVGKTDTRQDKNLIGQKHPHGRGEDPTPIKKLNSGEEKPTLHM